jgi:hypothetical protein
VTSKGHVSGNSDVSIWGNGVFELCKSVGTNMVSDGKGHGIFWGDKGCDFLGVGLEFTSLFGVITLASEKEAE